MTDSEGIQDKTPSHGLPALVLPQLTQRSEAVQTGMARVVGTEVDAIVASLREFLEDRTCITGSCGAESPSGQTLLVFHKYQLTRIETQRCRPSNQPVL